MTTTPHHQDARVTIHHGDCLNVLRTLPDNSIHAVITDPPYGLEFMGKDWDKFSTYSGGNPNLKPQGAEIRATGDGEWQPGRAYGGRQKNPRCRNCGKLKRGNGACKCPAPQWDTRTSESAYQFQMFCEEWAAECLRVLRPGGHMLAFGGTRTWHRLTCAIEDAGFEVRDSIAWLYGSGFSKSWNFKTQFQGTWCECANPLPYDHAGNADLHRMRGNLSAPTLARSPRDGADMLAEVQRSESGPGLGNARTQGSSGVVTGSDSFGGREDERLAEPGMARRDVHRTGEGLPDGPLAGASSRTSERVRGRAPAGDGADDRAAGPVAGGSASHQRGPGGQPTGEPAAVPGSHVPLDDGALRDGPVCASCGGLDPAFKAFGTGLKPGHEPIVVARKPLAGTVAANVLAHGTGALNVDACRVGNEPHRPTGKRKDGAVSGGGSMFFLDGFATLAELEEAAARGEKTPKGRDARATLARAGAARTSPTPPGRWPANVVLDGTQADALDAQSGITKDTAHRRNAPKAAGTYGAFAGDDDTRLGHGDSGGASRFFPVFRYEPKAPTRQRPTYTQDGAGNGRVTGLGGKVRQCNVCETRAIDSGATEPSCGHGDYRWADPTTDDASTIAHATVKPVDLMRWLIRLVIPPGGTILDPFAGSGATVEAAILEGVGHVIAIEREAEYLPLITARLHPTRPRRAPRPTTSGPTQPDLFEGLA
jgi:DNA modification methylase